MKQIQSGQLTCSKTGQLYLLLTVEDVMASDARKGIIPDAPEGAKHFHGYGRFTVKAQGRVK